MHNAGVDSFGIVLALPMRPIGPSRDKAVYCQSETRRPSDRFRCGLKVLNLCHFNKQPNKQMANNYDNNNSSSNNSSETGEQVPLQLLEANRHKFAFNAAENEMGQNEASTNAKNYFAI